MEVASKGREITAFGLLEALFGAVRSGKSAVLVKKTVELVGLVVERWAGGAEVAVHIVECVGNVWKSSFAGADEDIQLKQAVLTTLIHTFHRFPLPPALLTDLVSLVAFAIDPVNTHSLHLRDVTGYPGWTTAAVGAAAAQ